MRRQYLLLLAIPLIAFTMIVMALSPNVLAAPALQSGGHDYIIQEGDSLSTIAQHFYGNGSLWPKIVEGTNAKAKEDPSYTVLAPRNFLRIGQKVWIEDLSAPASNTAASEPHVRFVRPLNGATVTPTFAVEMEATGLTVEPAGAIHDGAGHMHILVDTDFVAPGEIIPFDQDHRHFGKGQLTTVITLTPGIHVLRLQFANGGHIALEGDQYRDTITVTVAAALPPVVANTTPGVHFVRPLNGAVVPPTFDVQMEAISLTVEPAGQIHEGAGHMHILVDTDFIAPGEVIPFDEQHHHFGKGQLTTVLTLTPGIHVLNLQFANGGHIALDGPQYRDTITVTVSPEAAAPPVNTSPGVHFVRPLNGAVVSPTFEVQMQAISLTVEPAGEIHEGAGHMHILVDTDFISPGEVIPFDEQHHHFGKGQLTTVLTLTPGIHVLNLQFANGGHIALDGPQYRDTITVTVAGGAAPTAATHDHEVGVHFVSPLNGAVVSPTFEVALAANGLKVEPSGEVHEGAGHMHVLVDTDFITPGQVILFDEHHIHLGKGQLTTTLTLSPGVHVLRLQFANGGHIALDGPQYRDTVTVTVAGAAAPPPVAANTSPGVHFVRPLNGAVVSPTFEVQMQAISLTVEPAGEIHEGAGHMHILVDTDFVAPGEVVPFDEQHHHFGKGQLTATLTLTPGVHVLNLQFANGGHIALDGPQYRDTITVTVVPTATTPSAPAAETPGVHFVEPKEGAVVSSTFDVQMVANELKVEPAGAIHEGAGHLHILVDTDFVDPGDLIVSDDQHIHLGKGQLTTKLTLTPGVHVLHLQFANGAHIALDGDQYRDTIRVTVAK